MIWHARFCMFSTKNYASCLVLIILGVSTAKENHKSKRPIVCWPSCNEVCGATTHQQEHTVFFSSLFPSQAPLPHLAVAPALARAAHGQGVPGAARPPPLRGGGKCLRQEKQKKKEGFPYTKLR